MKKIERFLNSNYYLILITLIGFLTWVMKDDYQQYNEYGMLLLLIPMSLIFMLFENTMYTMPLFATLLYIYNVQGMNLETISGFHFVYVLFFFLVIGPIVHLIRFKPTFKKGALFLAFFLSALAQILSIFYVKVTPTYLQISLFGFFYLLLYVFFVSTSKPSLAYVMKIMFFMSLLLSGEILFNIYQGFQSYGIEIGIKERIKLGMKTSWGRGDYGWGNINDVVIHLVLMMPSQVYYLLKYPKRLVLWFFPLLSSFTIFLSASRGGYISLGLSILCFAVILIRYGKRHTYYNGLIALVVTSLILIKFPVLVETAVEVFMQGGLDDLDQFSSSRITLYKHAVELFKQYPIFGAGWESMTDIGNPNRIQVFHSTLFHTMAVMGSFGLIALVVYFYQTYRLMIEKRKFEVLFIMIGVTVTQIHGLIDNTQFMLVYTFITIILMVSIENNTQIETKTVPILN